MSEKTVILIPVYNDWESLKILIGGLNNSLSSSSHKGFEVLIVDDGSPTKPGMADVQILSLNRNIGHQKAIAIGLAYIHENISCERILIMDADGEDRPEDAKKILDAADANTGNIVLAQRGNRQETPSFRFFYSLYKIVFRLLTGRKISYGNFMAIPKKQADNLVYYSEIWNHLPAAILKSGLPFVAIETDRGKRYAGLSKMSFGSLVLHGFGAIAVFIEQIATRLLALSIILITVSLVAIAAILVIRSFTNLAIPGWASTVMLSMIVVLLQGFLLSLFTLFLFLSSQSQRKFIPAHHYRDYTAKS